MAANPLKNGASIIAVSGLRTQFGQQVVHDNLDLEVRPGEVIGVVGGSGTGKRSGSGVGCTRSS